MTIKYRAVHEGKRWRPASHKTLHNAIDGLDGARNLLLRRGRVAKKWDDYGEVRGVFVWEDGADTGRVFRLKPGTTDMVEAATVPAVELDRLEAVKTCTSLEIASYFSVSSTLIENTDSSEPELEPDDEVAGLPSWVITAIRQRRGQLKFRARLLHAYESRCAVTGCDAIPALEAAHIVPFAEEQEYGVDAGILLRCDIHTLFDLKLLSVDPNSLIVRVSHLLRAYQEYDGKPLALPSDQAMRPDPARLARHFDAFRKRAR